jgi:methylglutaconyl-CoA hydratase
MILTGRIVSGQEALGLGLIDAVAAVKDSGDGKIETVETALALANQICEGGPVAIQQALQAVQGQSAMAEVNAYEIVLNTQDRLAALKAFAEKKPVEFAGQ